MSARRIERQHSRSAGSSQLVPVGDGLPDRAALRRRRAPRLVATLAMSALVMRVCSGSALPPEPVAHGARAAGDHTAQAAVRPGHGEAAAGRAARILAHYFGNTLVCAGAITGNDLCHLWLNRDGTFIQIDPTGGHAGHYRVGPVRADGKVPVCLYWDTPNMVMPPGLLPLPGATPAASPGRVTAAILCRTSHFLTTCSRVDPASLSATERRMTSMGQRFHHGMCYPLADNRVGAIWLESDDPLPAQGGKDKLLLVPGRI